MQPKAYRGTWYELRIRQVVSRCVHGWHLLCWQAQSGELPNDFDRLSRLADGMSVDTWKAIRDKFQVDEATDGLFNERMRAEMDAAADRVAKGRKAAQTRWGKGDNASAYADALPTHMPKKEREREREKEPQQSLTESNTDPESRLQAAGLQNLSHTRSRLPAGALQTV